MIYEICIGYQSSTDIADIAIHVDSELFLNKLGPSLRELFSP
jgi:hypothetical protein